MQIITTVAVRLMGLWLVDLGLMGSIDILVAGSQFAATMALVASALPLLVGGRPRLAIRG